MSVDQQSYLFCIKAENLTGSGASADLEEATTEKSQIDSKIDRVAVSIHFNKAVNLKLFLVIEIMPRRRCGQEDPHIMQLCLNAANLPAPISTV